MPTPDQVARAILCLREAVGEDGAINVNVVGGDPVVGASTFSGETIVDQGSAIPDNWSSFTVLNETSSTGNVTLAGSVLLPPGASVSHGTWDGFPGNGFTVEAESGASAVLTWVIATPA